ncbi:urea transporter [Tirmania nivea]|nr:urea transporter [Tirmania nivea]
MGSSILFSYPELSTIVGIQGTFTYAAASALPLMAFVFLGPIIRKKLPKGFIMTTWVRHRYGEIAGAYISFLTLAIMFLYMVAELSALQQVIGTLAGIDGLPVIIVQVIVTTIYTSLGGFKVSFVTDNIQGVMICGLVIICSIAIGTSVKIDTSMIAPSGLMKPSLLGYQLIYTLFIGIICSDMFLSGFWMRTFASRTDKDLAIGVSIATFAVFVILALVGATGLIAVWSGIPEPGAMAFFLLMGNLPAWVVAFAIVMVVSLSCAVFDSLQSAMISTASEELFRNKLPLPWVRGMVVLVIVPVIVVAIKSPSILQIFLISNLAASAAVPSVFLGLSRKFYFIQGFEVVCGSLGGIFSVWVFGMIFYHGDANAARKLIILASLYAPDWSVFGTFLVAPVAGLLITFAVCALRLGVRYAVCKSRGERFDGFDRPMEPPSVDEVTAELERESRGVSHPSYGATKRV